MIQENRKRYGNFSSSEIHNLVTSGKRQMTDEELASRPKKGKGSSVTLVDDFSTFSTSGNTYIAKKNIERKMGVYLKPNVMTRPIAWGHFIEYYVFENYLGSDYESLGDTTFVHPLYDYWVGSPDYRNTSKSIIADCKGYEREQFSYYADVILQSDYELFKKERPEEFWQLVSNAIIMDCKYIQPILFMPYQSELNKMREAVENYDGWIPLHSLRFIHEGLDSELNYLPDGCYYENLITNIYEVSKEDKDFLTQKVTQASKLLINK